jgi:hypothetical protein
MKKKRVAIVAEHKHLLNVLTNPTKRKLEAEAHLLDKVF